MECNEYEHDNNGDVDDIKFTRISAIVGKTGNFKIGTTIVGKEGEKYVMNVFWDIPIFPDVCLEAYEYNKYPYEKYKQLEDGSDSTPYCIIEERTSKMFGDDHVNNKFVVFGSRNWTFLRILKAYGYAWLRALLSWSLILAFVLFCFVPRCGKQDSTPDTLNDIVFYDENGGMKEGVFSVSDSTKVQFSCGNLLYKPETKEWFFAPWQGAMTYNGCISTFAWIGADNPTEKSVDYKRLLESNQFHRYGYYPIKNGGNAYGQWRKMTYSEWAYLLWHRPNARKLRQRSEIAWPKHRWIEGFFIFPDGWKWPEGVKGSWDVAYYSVEEWQKMMIAGAVFLPYIDDSSASSVLTWTSSYKLDTLKSGEVRCLPYYVLPFKMNFDIRTTHRELERIPVRLVKDVNH